MKASEFQKFLDDYLAGELKSGRLAQFERAVEENSEFREELDTHLKIQELLASRAAPAAPESLRRGVMKTVRNMEAIHAEVQAETAAAAARGGWRFPGIFEAAFRRWDFRAAVAVCCVGVVAICVIPQMPTDESPVFSEVGLPRLRGFAETNDWVDNYVDESAELQKLNEANIALLYAGDGLGKPADGVEKGMGVSGGEVVLKRDAPAKEPDPSAGDRLNAERNVAHDYGVWLLAPATPPQPTKTPAPFGELMSDGMEGVQTPSQTVLVAGVDEKELNGRGAENGAVIQEFLYLESASSYRHARPEEESLLTRSPSDPKGQTAEDLYAVLPGGGAVKDSDGDAGAGIQKSREGAADGLGVKNDGDIEKFETGQMRDELDALALREKIPAPKSASSGLNNRGLAHNLDLSAGFGARGGMGGMEKEEEKKALLMKEIGGDDGELHDIAARPRQRSSSSSRAKAEELTRAMPQRPAEPKTPRTGEARSTVVSESAELREGNLAAGTQPEDKLGEDDSRGRRAASRGGGAYELQTAKKEKALGERIMSPEKPMGQLRDLKSAPKPAGSPASGAAKAAPAGKPMPDGLGRKSGVALGIKTSDERSAETPGINNKLGGFGVGMGGFGGARGGSQGGGRNRGETEKLGQRVASTNGAIPKSASPLEDKFADAEQLLQKAEIEEQPKKIAAASSSWTRPAPVAIPAPASAPGPGVPAPVIPDLQQGALKELQDHGAGRSLAEARRVPRSSNSANQPVAAGIEVGGESFYYRETGKASNVEGLVTPLTALAEGRTARYGYYQSATDPPRATDLTLNLYVPAAEASRSDVSEPAATKPGEVPPSQPYLKKLEAHFRQLGVQTQYETAASADDFERFFETRLGSYSLPHGWQEGEAAGSEAAEAKPAKAKAGAEARAKKTKETVKGVFLCTVSGKDRDWLLEQLKEFGLQDKKPRNFWFFGSGAQKAYYIVRQPAETPAGETAEKGEKRIAPTSTFSVSHSADPQALAQAAPERTAKPTPKPTAILAAKPTAILSVKPSPKPTPTPKPTAAPVPTFTFWIYVFDIPSK